MNAKLVVILALAACASGTESSARPKSMPTPPRPPMTQKAVMNLSYSRTGGFAGFNDQVQVHGGTVTVTRRGKTTLERKLTEEEKAELNELGKAAQAEKVTPAPPHRPTPDAFNYTVGVDGETVKLDSPPENLPPAWAKLTERLERFLAEHPDR